MREPHVPVNAVFEERRLEEAEILFEEILAKNVHFLFFAKGYICLTHKHRSRFVVKFPRMALTGDPQVVRRPRAQV